MRTKHVAFLALILLLPWLSACTESGAMPVTMLGGGVTAAGPAEPDPDVYYECEDNAATATIVATYGSNGAITNGGGSNLTEDNTSTTSFAGSRSIALNDDLAFIGGIVTEASIEDGVFTIQFAYYGNDVSGFGAGYYVRLFAEGSSGVPLLMWSDNGSDTSFDVYIDEDLYDVTLDDINTASWHVIRVVVDTGAGSDKLRVYQGATVGALALKYESDAAAVTAPTLATTAFLFGGNGAENRGVQVVGGLLDEIKIWYTAEVP